MLRISESQAERWQTIYEAGEDLFRRLHITLCRQDNPSIRASKLFDIVKSESESEVFAKAFCTEFIGLATFRRRRQRDFETVVDQLIGGMSNSLEDQVVKFFKDQKVRLVQLLRCDAIRLPAKALDLTTDQSVLFYAGNIVTDIRPVFDRRRENISGAIVTQNLKLHFFEDSGRSSERVVSLALDMEDIDNLISELERAKEKASACRRYVEQNGKSEVFVVGEESYDFG